MREDEGSREDGDRIREDGDRIREDGDPACGDGDRIRELSEEVGELFEKQEERADRLDAVRRELEDLAREAGVSLDLEAAGASAEERPARLAVPHDLAAAVGSLDEETRRGLERDFAVSAPAVPPMDELDRFVVISVGCMAALSDFVLVGLPPPTRWTPSKSEEGGLVPVGLISKLVKKWNVEGDNWLAKLCKVPYDRVVIEERGVTLPPHVHRVLTFGHDPSVFGFLVGMIDIITWSLSGTDIDGHIIRVPIPGPKPDLRTRVCLAPLLWLGHLVSDVATRQGIPVPGSSIFRLCRVPLPGAPDDADLSDLARKLYEQGYDFRQYVVGGVMVSGVVEGFVRLYDWMRHADEEVARDGIRARLAENYVADARRNARLASRLFWAHAIASGANAGRITLQAAGTHDFFSAARNVNLAEWKTFAKRTVEYVGALARETDLDQALENRRRLEERWGSLLADKGAPRGAAGREEGKGEAGRGSLLAEGAAAQVLYMEPPSGVRFEKVAL